MNNTPQRIAKATVEDVVRERQRLAYAGSYEPLSLLVARHRFDLEVSIFEIPSPTSLRLRFYAALSVEDEAHQQLREDFVLAVTTRLLEKDDLRPRQLKFVLGHIPVVPPGECENS